MAKIGKYRKRKWLKKEDVEGLSLKQRRTTIIRVVEEEVGDDLKPVCYFEGIEKGWPINMGGLEVLELMTGSDNTDDYVGAHVELYVDPTVKFQGKCVGGIKLHPLEAATSGADGIRDEDIPF